MPCGDVGSVPVDSATCWNQAVKFCPVCGSPLQHVQEHSWKHTSKSTKHQFVNLTWSIPVLPRHIHSGTLWLESSGSEPWKTYTESNDAWSKTDTIRFLLRTSTYLSIYFLEQISPFMQLVWQFLWGAKPLLHILWGNEYEIDLSSSNP